jgi:hypothetical protein
MNQETRAILTSSLVGAIIGWVVGVAQLVYIGSWPLFYWAFMPLIPIYSAVGGALDGKIFGGGGMFASRLTADTDTGADTASRSHAA